jgi:catalase
MNGATHTNQRDGAVAYYQDGEGQNPHFNHEPSITGLREAEDPTHDEHIPF